MASIYVNFYRPWPGWIVESLEEIADVHNCQVGTYKGHADKDHGDQTGKYAADLWLYSNTTANRDKFIAWFIVNAERIGGLYVIANRKIWNIERADEGVREYDGDDPHTSHVHISYLDEAPEGEDDMPTVREIMETPVIDSPDGKSEWSLGGYIRNTRGQVDTVEERLEVLETQLAEVLAILKAQG